MARHDGGGGLPECARLHVVGEIADHAVLHLEVDLDGRAAQLGMGRCRGIRVGKPPQTRDIARQFDDFLVVDVVQHAGRNRFCIRPLPVSDPCQPLAVVVQSLYNAQDAGINRLHFSIAGNIDGFFPDLLQSCR